MFYTIAVSDDTGQGSGRKRGVHWAIKAWFFFHCFAIVTRTIPVPTEEDFNRVAKPGVTPVKLNSEIKVANLKSWRQKEWLVPYYTETLGFWQYWDMFAPNPAQEDVWIDAVVEFADGSEKVESYPRMAEMPLTRKFLYERYRKYRERITDTQYSWKWPHTANWFAAKAWTDESNPPVRVTLRWHSYRVPPPPAKPDYTYSSNAFYTALIDRTAIAGMRP